MNQWEIVGLLLMVVGDLGPILAGVIIGMSTTNPAAVEGSLIPEPVFLASLGALVGGAILFVVAGERAVERAAPEAEDQGVDVERRQNLDADSHG
jgi:hypothetical protein